MRDVVGGNTIVITEIPLALEKDDGMMGRPAHYGVKYDTLIGEGSIGIVADGIAEHVAVACRVRKIVFVFVFMHPRGLEETVGVASLQGITIVADDDNGAWSLCKLHHIIAHADYLAG